MVEERQEEQPASVGGFSKYPTSVLLAVRERQEQGLAEVHRHWQAGTINVRHKDGAATAKEAGETIVMLYDAITLELQQRGVLE